MSLFLGVDTSSRTLLNSSLIEVKNTCLEELLGVASGRSPNDIKSLSQTCTEVTDEVIVVEYECVVGMQAFITYLT